MEDNEFGFNPVCYGVDEVSESVLEDNGHGCYWCENALEHQVWTEPFLGGLFGYLFCSRKCVLNYLNSK